MNGLVPIVDAMKSGMRTHYGPKPSSAPWWRLYVLTMLTLRDRCAAAHREASK